MHPIITAIREDLRKAIGWVLRDYSYTNPQWVKQFVARHSDLLSGLSKREALKQINRLVKTNADREK